jgi:hypothetical protein
MRCEGKKIPTIRVSALILTLTPEYQAFVMGHTSDFYLPMPLTEEYEKIIRNVEILASIWYEELE